MVVALSALGILTALTLVTATRDVNELVREEQDQTLESIVRAAAAAYARAGSWPNTDLDGVRALASGARADLMVRDRSGRVILRNERDHDSRSVRVVRVRAAGEHVGTVRVAFADRLSSPARHLRQALTTTVLVGAAVAALLALAVGVITARRITRPVTALMATARDIEKGDRAARVGDIRAPGELAALASTFDRMADTLARQDTTRRALVADVAHELRTPLTVLLASLEGMVDGTIDASPVQLSSLRDDALRLAKSVDDLEILAAADAAALTLDLRVVDVAAVATRVVARLADQFASAEVEVDVVAEPVLLRGDAQRLEQVTTNLLTNALKFTPAGGSVKVEVRRGGNHTAELVVTDTGIGIAPEDRDHVFDRFYRGAAARGIAGSGIGLTVVAELVAAHHGTVDIWSEPGRGTGAVVTLPAI